MAKQTIKEKVDKILYESHLIRANAAGTDISKTAKADAKKKSKALLKQLKDIDEAVYNIIKVDFEK
jgi:hypothetical protein|tara:strand:+ start:483 stop:680 length:198 start_codon:yes stop_codon:yes gene_type:complete